MDNQKGIEDAFLKQLQTGDQLNSFLAQLQKRGIEKILEGELDAHLGYDKHSKAPAAIARNGSIKKNVKTSFGESSIQVPRDRDASCRRLAFSQRHKNLRQSIMMSLYSSSFSSCFQF